MMSAAGAILMALVANHEAQAKLIEALAQALAEGASPTATAPDPGPVADPIPEPPAEPRRHRIADLCDHPDVADTGIGVHVCADCGANL